MRVKISKFFRICYTSLVKDGEKISGYIPSITAGERFEPQPIDPLRGTFNQHVVGPLAHVVVSFVFDAVGDKFLQYLRDGEIKIEESSYLVSKPAIAKLNKLNPLLCKIGYTHIAQQEEPISSLLSPRQQAAMQRFGRPRMRSVRNFDTGLFDEITTISRTIRTISERHPELELGDIGTLATFLRDPQTHRIFRSFGRGANAFADGFIRTPYPPTRPWFSDNKKPVLDTSGEVPRVSSEVREAVRRSHEINARVLDHPLSLREREEVVLMGLDGSAKQSSSGCPARHLLFRTDEPSLVANGLSLEPAQVNTLRNLTTLPVIERFNDSTYLIRRDSYAETSQLLATALELAQQR